MWRLVGLCRSGGGLSAVRLVLGAQCEHPLCGAQSPPVYVVATNWWEIVTEVGLGYVKKAGVMGMIAEVSLWAERMDAVAGGTPLVVVVAVTWLVRVSVLRERR